MYFSLPVTVRVRAASFANDEAVSRRIWMPGLDEDYVPQGLAVDGQSVLVAAYRSTDAKTADSFIIEDPFSTQIDFTTSSARFVNASPNSNPMTLYAKNTVTGDSVVVGSATYAGISPWAVMIDTSVTVTA